MAWQSRSTSADHGLVRADSQIAASLVASSCGRGSIRGPSTATTPGRQTRGLAKPSGNDTPGGRSVVSSRHAGPRAATTSFDPELNPLPE